MHQLVSTLYTWYGTMPRYPYPYPYPSHRVRREGGTGPTLRIHVHPHHPVRLVLIPPAFGRFQGVVLGAWGCTDTGPPRIGDRRGLRDDRGDMIRLLISTFSPSNLYDTGSVQHTHICTAWTVSLTSSVQHVNVFTAWTVSATGSVHHINNVFTAWTLSGRIYVIVQGGALSDPGNIVKHCQTLSNIVMGFKGYWVYMFNPCN